jgi:hypothetical protein
MQLPWVEFVIDTIGNVHQIQCAICSKVEGKPKLLVPKLDNFLKHVYRSSQSQGYKSKSRSRVFVFSSMTINMHVMNKFTPFQNILLFLTWLCLKPHKKNKIKLFNF